MFPKYYIHSTLSTPLSIQKVATCQISFVETKSIWRTLKVEKPLLESSSEMNKLQCVTNTEHSPDTKITVMGTRFPAQDFE